MMKRATPPSQPRARAQRGFILIFTLVALTVMLIAAAALVRAMDSGLLQAGNLAYQGDLANFSQRGIAAARTSLTSGSLSDATTRNSHLTSANYSATRLASNAQGIPNALLASDSDFATTGTTDNDISDSTLGITLRFVIDRQCASTGDPSTVSCVFKTMSSETAADDRYRRVNGESRPVYRITVRATGPRRTLAFFQANVAL